MNRICNKCKQPLGSNGEHAGGQCPASFPNHICDSMEQWNEFTAAVGNARLMDQYRQKYQPEAKGKGSG